MVPGQDILIAQFGAAAVFLILVVVALITLWKTSKAEREGRERERREAEAANFAALERSRSEFFVELGKIRAEQQEAFEQSRAEFLMELRRRDDALQSQQARFETTIANMHRDNAAAVQAMHEKSDRSAQNFAAIADALSRRLTTQG